MVVALDNGYGKDGSSALDESSMHSICKAALQEHLENGVLLSAVGIQNTPKSNLKQFAKAVINYDACVHQGEKAQAAAINLKYGVRLAFKPLSYLPEE